MDILASRLAKDSNVKSKSNKKVKKLAKDDLGKSKTRSVPKVDSSKTGKISKKQKVKNVVVDVPSKKKQAIKGIIQSQNNENEKLIQKVTNVKNKKLKLKDVKEKVKDIKKSLKDVISKPDKVGKKNTGVLKNKINLQSNIKPSIDIPLKNDPQKKSKNKNVQPELAKTNQVKQSEPEVTNNKRMKVEPQMAKNKKIKSKTVIDSKIEDIKPIISASNLESEKNAKLNKKGLKSKTLKDNITNIAKTTKSEKEEKGLGLDNKLNLSKTLKSKKVDLVNVENNGEIQNIKSKKRKQEDIEKEDIQSSAQPTVQPTAQPTLTKKEILPLIKGLLKIAANDSKTKKALFDSEKPPILLSVASVRVPKVPLHQTRILLPHSMVKDDDDVALFVKDLKRGRRRDYEDTVHHYEDLLQQHGCTRVKTILPINQVKTEYRQFEMRRRLLNSYDYFLADGRIAGQMAHLLGKTFRLNRKLPTSIHMDKKDLKREIDNALKKTSLEIHSTGNNSIAQIATCSMSADKIADNVLAAVKHLSEHFPGGWNNIRSLCIKTPLSLAIPIYVTLKNRNEVAVPVVSPKRPKAYQDVEGELSTFTRNVSVKVAADGTVDFNDLGGNESDNEFDIDEEDESEEVSKKTEKKITKEKTKDDENKITTEKTKDDSDDDEGEEENEDDDDNEEQDDESDDE